MPRKKSSPGIETTDYRHDERRKNIPPAQIAGEGEVPRARKVRYAYNPHLPPVLRFDDSGKTDRKIERLRALVDKAGTEPLSAEEQSEIREAFETYNPWLEWSGKHEEHERGYFEVEPVALHIHERVSAQAVVRAAMREDVQRDLFADPQQPYREAVQFYKHDVDWANRLILGDSLQVMTSLARRENLAGKVQMIYMDPPYGIRYASNFQPFIHKREVSDKDVDLTREAETVHAYRDTWSMGVHSYLSYLRVRLEAARMLLAAPGSMFVQISDVNMHRVRALLDEIFGAANFVKIISVQKTGGLSQSLVPGTMDYLLWYAKDAARVKYHQLYVDKAFEEGSLYSMVALPSGEHRRSTPAERRGEASLPLGAKVFRDTSLESANPTWEFCYQDRTYRQRWKTNSNGLERIARAERIFPRASTLQYQRFLIDFPVMPITNNWTDTGSGSFVDPQIFAVQTPTKVVARCILMTTDPGDLVLDPTCGSGTTAIAAELWGRRWITIDTSRVAVALARQRLITARHEAYATKRPPSRESSADPGGGFVYRSVPHITLKSIAQNANLDPIFERHESRLDRLLFELNRVLKMVTAAQRAELLTKLHSKQRSEGKRSVSEADRRRWQLPDRFEHWTAPFDVDHNWPQALQDAVARYRSAWREKMEEVNACIEANAEQEELVDQPEVLKGIVRVSGPFTVEGVRPEELSLGENGAFDPTPNAFEDDPGAGLATGLRNLNAYLTRMVQHLRADGVTFLDNKRLRFARLDPLFETATASLLHAEGVWETGDADGRATVAVGFGPQYGPVTAAQVEDLIRASRRYDELVIAGFSFDAEATALIQEDAHPKLRIHAAFIRPDLNEAMEGLLKDTPNSQLFTVFGQPEIKVKRTKGGEVVVELVGVDIYDPVENTVRSSAADKVAAWFLDGDFDGRCFCITQAFFPDQDAWSKIAKALGSAADEYAFEAFAGTVSLPFVPGKHRRIAVKVIDPRGNEVMAIHRLDA
ncbi:MAG: site-specific DNA-methyltransferase [Thermoanaerobaculia bacterium]